MDLARKLDQLIGLQNSRLPQKIGAFNGPISGRQVLRIEHLLEESLSPEFLELYSITDGQVWDAHGTLFGDRLLNSDEIIETLEFSRTLIKPARKIIGNKAASDELLRRIVDFYLFEVLREQLARVESGWFKIEFECSPNSCGGPFLYPNQETTLAERKVLEIDFDLFVRIIELVRELHSLEKETYNWDQLDFVVFPNGDFEVDRTFYDFDNELPLTSSPSESIKRKYFHWKWLPVFSDQGGNYIGIDLDPDINGRKGQIITFGRDVEDMFVLAESLSDFFDFVLYEAMDPNGPLFDDELYLPETLKELKSRRSQ